ncbi:hypothetical protein [Solicola sp. PLA-1-18]|uniref:hypothetical protein n=1 Tax=Solicola sp. PLA-1-18 TaxID=3380532 RepID=UPI003B76954F
MRMARTGWVAVGLMAALTTSACTGDATRGGAARAEAAAPTTATTPAPPPDPCTLLVSGRQVALDGATAVRVTDLAAAAVRAAGDAEADPSAVAAQLADVPELAAVAAPASSALLGREGPALTCAHPRGTSDESEAGESGLTPRADALLGAMNQAFGRLPTGGYATGGVDSGHTSDSAHYDGRAIDVFFRPSSDAAQRHRGWTVAQWLVARADRTSLLSVIYRDRIWTVWASGAGWRDYVHPSGNTTNKVLRHLDHVHTAVVGGDRRRDDD